MCDGASSCEQHHLVGVSAELVHFGCARRAALDSSDVSVTPLRVVVPATREESDARVEESEKRVEESEKRVEESEKRVEESEKRVE